MSSVTLISLALCLTIVYVTTLNTICDTIKECHFIKYQGHKIKSIELRESEDNK